MIARLWRARIDASRVKDYAAYFEEHLRPALGELPGYRGAQVLFNGTAHPCEIVVVTWWTSLNAIQRFAGNDPSRAVIGEEARRMLLSVDETVTHYEVVLDLHPAHRSIADGNTE
jgi:heme-degrading monooxygenase HmoA